MSLIVGTAVAGGGSAPYQISRSLRFNSADSAYLNRTPASAGNRRTFTLSFWVKSGSLATGTTGQILGTTVGTFDRINFGENSTAQLSFTIDGAGTPKSCLTPGVYRDPSAWYHFVVAVDTTQATNTNRVKIYGNGVQQTLTGTFPDQNYQSSINNNVAQYLGSDRGSTYLFSGYMTEVYFIDGQQLTPSSFGQTNPNTGVWEPINYAGTYGTNGFELSFADNSNNTAATLGKDTSGNGNNWTPNNFSVAAGAGNDSLVDTPTNYGTDTGIGGSVRGNYCTLNPLKNEMTLSNGNLAISGGLDTTTTATMAVPSTGKWYFEFVPTSMPASNANIGLASGSFNITNSTFAYAEHRIYIQSGNKADGSGSVAYGASWTTSDVIGVAVDMDAGTLVFYKNNTSQGTAFSDLVSSGKTWFPLAANYGSGTFEGNFNFGQRAFAYTAPSGFQALCTQNLPTPTIGATSTTLAGKYFNPVLYTGTGSTRDVTGVGFSPDLVWVKRRSAIENNLLANTISGGGKSLYSNLTLAEQTNEAGGYISAFVSDGFTVTAGSSSSSAVNASGSTYVAWNWNAGGSTVTNTSGTISAQVRANTTSGFSIVTYTGTGVNATVGHGLGVVPGMIIAKRRSATQNWGVAHSSLTGTQTLYLDLTQGVATGVWNGTPTSTVFNITTDGVVNTNGSTYVAYCFAPVAGYSAFGSYTGNGSTDGPFVYLGFRPEFVMVKRTDSTESWYIIDAVRDPYNVSSLYLSPNGTSAEASSIFYDLVSNGFKLRTSAAYANASGGTYIYAAFAESPFKYSLAR